MLSWFADRFNGKGPGFTRASHSAGVLGVSAMAFGLGRWPEHFWVMYFVICWMLIPIYILRMARAGKGLYALEPCWVANAAAAAYLAAVACRAPPGGLRLWALRALYSTSLGFLSWSTIVSHNALIFHSFSDMVFLFIHVAPAVACSTLRWPAQWQRSASLACTWPGRFPDAAALEGTTSDQVVFAGMIPYGLWWVSYTPWLLAKGVNMPARGQRTGFAVFRRHREGLFAKVGPEIRVQAAVYMVVHAVLCCASFCWSALCWKFWPVNVAWVALIVLHVLWHTAGRYMSDVVQDCSRELDFSLPDSDA